MNPYPPQVQQARRSVGLVAISALMLMTAPSERGAQAITINMEYTDEGDTPPHPENPSWDPAGVILKQHFAAAKAIWEYLLPGGGEYDFDFHWDNDIDGLGQYNTGIDDYIEINPDQLWFADPTPGDNVEFNPGAQILYSGLSAANQSTYFPGTAPPGTLEVSYRATGITTSMALNTTSLSGQMTTNASGVPVPVDAGNGFDLLSTVLHEIGHALGLNGTEPGEYNIDPQHLGGFNNLLVLEGEGGHLGGHWEGPPNAPVSVPGFLMCDGCGIGGQRRYPTATDVLAIAEDQGITVVQLARVGSITSNSWSTGLNWIGGDVPDATQDVYISHGGGITLDVDATAKNLLISPGNALAVGGRQFSTNGTLTFTSGAVTVGAGGTLAANTLVGDSGGLTTAAGSLVRFNQFTGITSPTASFGGSLAVGFDNIPGGLTPPQTTFNPSLAAWNIAENLVIGDETFADLIVDNGTWTVDGDVALGKVLTATGGGWGGTVTLQNNAVMEIGGNVSVEGPGAAIIVEGTTRLDIAGNVTIGKGGVITYRDGQQAESRPHFIAGGQSAPFDGNLVSGIGGALIFEDTSNAADATIVLEGAAGEESQSGAVVFRDDSSAGDASTLPRASFRTKGGRRGPSAAGFETAGYGGVVRFEGTSGARDSTFINEGGAEYLGGTGGQTVFTQNASAENSTIDNHGATYFTAEGGATHFLGNSTADRATITNHATGSSSFEVSSARTIFHDISSAGNATIENLGATGQSVPFGRTEFRGNSVAGVSNIHNRTHLSPGGLAGRTDFYDDASAEDATIHTYEGYSDAGRIEFHDRSTAARARLIVENVPGIVGSSGNGGHIVFRDNSRAAQSQIFLKADACCNGVQFRNFSRADNVQIIQENGSGNVSFFDNSRADNAIIDVGRGVVDSFYDSSTADDATFTLSYGSQLQFQNHSSAGNAHIVAEGSSLYPWAGAAITFNSTSTVNNSTITLAGASVPLGSGASAAFINGAHAGNATITANGGTGGGGGAQITFNSGARGDTARLIANAGATVDFLSQNIYGGTSVGSIEGAGTFVLRGSELAVGTRNLNTTVTGPIKDNPNSNPFYSGGRLTKVGIGTLELAGANEYSGLTTINAGTLSVTGSITGGAVVNSGGALKGTGTIAGGVTVNPGGVFAPGTSPGTMTIGGLTMTSGATLNFEIGNPARDRLILTGGNVTLAGTLNISLLDGFTPTLGQSFPLFEGAVGSITGVFAEVNAPVFNGLSFDVVQTADSVLLQVGESATLAADFDEDGDVDGNDLVKWRGGFGTGGGATHVQGDANADGAVDGADFLVWQRQLGSAASMAPNSQLAPEPSGAVFALAILIAATAGRGWRA